MQRLPSGAIRGRNRGSGVTELEKNRIQWEETLASADSETLRFILGLELQGLEEHSRISRVINARCRQLEVAIRERRMKERDAAVTA